MPNVYGAPEIDVQAVATKLRSSAQFILLDVREEAELAHARLSFPQTRVVPLSLLARKQLDALPEEVLDKSSEIVVLCHHGVRSAQVTGWLLQNGWTNVRSMAGGIDAYARVIDPAVGLY